MGREVRRVPTNWLHPKNALGRYEPKHDRSFDAAMDEWIKGRDEWNAPGNTRRAEWEAEHGPCPYEEWEGPPPDPNYYRPAWPEGSATAFQVYETVSEGTPVSPVFATREALIEWLVNDGSGMGIGGTRQPLSRVAAERFADAGFSPSMIGIVGVGLFSGVQMYERATAAPRSEDGGPDAP